MNDGDNTDLRRWCSGPNSDEEGNLGLTCNACGNGYSIDVGDEPTGLCNDCAQSICVENVPKLLDQIDATALAVLDEVEHELLGLADGLDNDALFVLMRLRAKYRVKP